MRAPREWRIEYGAEWQPSIDEADTESDRFRANLEALTDGIGFDPWKFSRPLIKEDRASRYGTTKDIAWGYRMVVFLRLDEARQACTFEWLMLERL